MNDQPVAVLAALRECWGMRWTRWVVLIGFALESSACGGARADTSTGFDLTASPGVTGWKLDGRVRTDPLPAHVRGLAPGRHDIALDAPPGFIGQRVRFTVEPDRVVAIDAVLEVKGATSKLTTTVKGGAKYIISDTDVEILDIIRFEPHSAVLMASSHPTLDAVAATLQGNASLQLVEVQSHTAEPADAADNQQLSQQRAQAIVQYLVARGVAPGRLVAHGYGSSEPLVQGSDAAARARNDRIAFVILRRGPTAAAPSTRTGSGRT